MEAISVSGLIIEDGFHHQSRYAEALPIGRECFLFFLRFISLIFLSLQLHRELYDMDSLAGAVCSRTSIRSTARMKGRRDSVGSFQGGWRWSAGPRVKERRYVVSGRVY